MVALLTCLSLVFLIHSGEVFAQGGEDEGFVRQVASSVNAYWGKEFQLLGISYAPAKLVLIYNKPVDGACGFSSVEEGPSYCPYDETLYYPVHWIYNNGRTLANYGRSAVEWAVAHEIGHNVQVQLDRAGIQRLDTIPLELIELQADCLSGMYLNRAAAQPEGVKAALAAIRDAGDYEHGTYQQRIAALQLGYKTGDLSRCLALTTGGATPNSSALQLPQQSWASGGRRPLPGQAV